MSSTQYTPLSYRYLVIRHPPLIEIHLCPWMFVGYYGIGLHVPIVYHGKTWCNGGGRHARELMLGPIRTVMQPYHGAHCVEL